MSSPLRLPHDGPANRYGTPRRKSGFYCHLAHGVLSSTSTVTARSLSLVVVVASWLPLLLLLLLLLLFWTLGRLWLLFWTRGALPTFSWSSFFHSSSLSCSFFFSLKKTKQTSSIRMFKNSIWRLLWLVKMNKLSRF